MRSNGHAKGILGKLTNQNFTDVYTRACGFISHICEKDIRCLYSGGVLTRTNTVITFWPTTTVHTFGIISDHDDLVI